MLKSNCAFPVLLSVQRTADILNVHPNTVRIWNDQGLFPAYRLGRRGDRKFDETDILEFIGQSNSSGVRNKEKKSRSPRKRRTK